MRLAKDKVELKRCPFCGSKVGVTDGVMGKIRMYCCMNFKGCGATISFDNPLANRMPASADNFFNNRAD